MWPAGITATHLLILTLQEFDFVHRKYDLIWVQWVIIYLTDADFIAFLKRAKTSLNPSGIIVIKDNILRSEGFWVDRSDNSIIRSDIFMRSLFARSGLSVLQANLQPNFPKELFPVMAYALA